MAAFKVYKNKNFGDEALLIISRVKGILEEYEEMGFRLTLRSLYYQFVGRGYTADWVIKKGPNKGKSGVNCLESYKRLGSIINDAKLAGLLPWGAVEDNHRTFNTHAAWVSPAQIVRATANQFHINRWLTQPYYFENWIEKDALTGVIEGICTELDIPYFACKGYISGSAAWAAGERFIKAKKAGKKCILLHMGDHDPSGIDMTRDNDDRVALFAGQGIKVIRLALNMAQIEEHNPPPNFAKESDSRFDSYSKTHGEHCWELDALDPNIIVSLIRDAVEPYIDRDAWEAVEEEEAAGRAKLSDIADDLEAA